MSLDSFTRSLNLVTLLRIKAVDPSSLGNSESENEFRINFENQARNFEQLKTSFVDESRHLTALRSGVENVLDVMEEELADDERQGSE